MAEEEPEPSLLELILSKGVTVDHKDIHRLSLEAVDDSLDEDPWQASSPPILRLAREKLLLWKAGYVKSPRRLSLNTRTCVWHKRWSR